MRGALGNSCLVVVVTFLLTGSSVWAQSGGESVTATPATATPAAPVQEAPVEIAPDPEKVERAGAMIDSMRKVLRQVLKYLEEARAERDIVKLNCVNYKLSSVKGLLKISESSEVAMQEALAKRNGSAAGHEYQKIAIASRKVEQLLAETEACVGELSIFSGETSVEVLISGPEPRPADPAAGPPTPTVVETRPPAASPFQ